jgi:hypothetical protein
VSEAYEGEQIVGMDLHRRRSVLVRMSETGECLETVRISNDPQYLAQVMARAGEARRWCWRPPTAGTGLGCNKAGVGEHVGSRLVDVGLPVVGAGIHARA